VVGKGQVIGGRAVLTLPQLKDFYQSLSLGVDYKHFEQDLMIAGTPSTTPVTYYPLSAAYSGSWIGKGAETDLNASANLHVRGWGSSEEEFDRNRFGADGSYIYVRGDLSHTHDLPEGFQVFVKGQGQAADKPLLNSEQFSGGGLGTVRGYKESEELGDNGVFGTIELRSPSLGSFFGKAVNDWRTYLFADGGMLTIDDPLPEQQQQFHLFSFGAGTRLKLQDHYNGSLDVGVPTQLGPSTHRYSPMLTFRLWAEF
jgi:hemolysin activation/secretion protein